jgi:Transposase IS66 family
VLGCWAHLRRKFYDLEQAHASSLARETLERIAAPDAIGDHTHEMNLSCEQAIHYNCRVLSSINSVSAQQGETDGVQALTRMVVPDPSMA